MDIRKNKQRIIRDRYSVTNHLFSDVFVSASAGYDQLSKKLCVVCEFHIQFVQPNFVDFCTEKLSQYLYLPVQNAFYLVDIEYDGHSFYVMYHVPTLSFQSLDIVLGHLRKQPDYSKQIMPILTSVLNTLAYFEAHQVSFGQISLNNIFITDSQTVILGPAQINMICLEYFKQQIDDFEDSIFFSPEVTQSFCSTIQSDIYAFGVLTYYCCTNDWPYSNDQCISRLQRAFRSPIVPPSDRNKSIRYALNYFILKCLQSSPDKRWQSFQPMIDVLNGQNKAQYESLSNQPVDHHMFESSMAARKKQVISSRIRRLVGVIGVAGLFFITYVGYVSYFQQYKIIQVPRVQSLDVEDAMEQLYTHKLVPIISAYYSHPSIPKGHVIRLDPPSGRRIKQGRSVRMYVSKGKKEVLVPDLVGKSLSTIDLLFNNPALNIEELSPEYSFLYEAGVVIRQTPQSNERMLQDTRIQVVLSKGSPLEFRDILNVGNDSIQVTIELIVTNTMDSFLQIYQSDQSTKNILYEGNHEPGDRIELNVTVPNSAQILVLSGDVLVHQQKVIRNVINF